MSWATTQDNVRLHYEEAGTGTPIVFVHEFAGDWRAWEPQMRHFARRHRCITYSARGRFMSIGFAGPASDVGTFNRLGAIRIMVAPDGKQS